MDRDKLIEALKAEASAFAGLCRVAVRFAVKKVRKEDVSAERTSLADLQKRSWRLQVALAALIVVGILFRGCGNSGASGGVGIVHADAEMVKEVKRAMAEQEEKNRQEQARQERERQAAEAKSAAAEKKSKEIEAARSAALEALDKQRANAFASLKQTLCDHAGKILADKGLPRFTLAGVTFGEPLPPAFNDFADTELPLKEPFMGFLKSMKVGLHDLHMAKWFESGETEQVISVVDSISLKGEIPENMTFSQAVDKMKELKARLDGLFGKKGKMDGHPVIEPDMAPSPDKWRAYGRIGGAEWEGLPQWNASLTEWKGQVSVELRGEDFMRFVSKALEAEWTQLIKKHSEEFEARGQKIEEEAKRKRQAVNGRR